MKARFERLSKLKDHRLIKDYRALVLGNQHLQFDSQLTQIIAKQFPSLTITSVPILSVPSNSVSASGQSICRLTTKDERRNAFDQSVSDLFPQDQPLAHDESASHRKDYTRVSALSKDPLEKATRGADTALHRQQMTVQLGIRLRLQTRPLMLWLLPMSM